jgi:hypothetical protein
LKTSRPRWHRSVRMVAAGWLVMSLLHRPPLVSGAEAAAAGSSPEVEVRKLVPAFNPRLDAVHAPAGFGTGRIWRVGPREQFHKPSEVVAKVHDGDIVEIDGGRYACDTGVKWRANFLTLVGVNGRPVIDATNCKIADDKGAWNPHGNGLIIANLEFAGAAGPSRNDAGVRYDGGGYLYLTRCFFHENQDGVLVTASDGGGTNVVVDRCEFARNGARDHLSHNIYISSGSAHQVNSLVIRFSYSHDSYGGHAVKTRALSNYVLYNRLADEPNSDSKSVVDISQGGLSYFIGNVIEHRPATAGAAMVSYSLESPHNSIQELYLVNNTLVSHRADDVAVRLADHAFVRGRMVGNLVVGISPSNLVSIASSRIALANNVITSTPHFLDAANRDYRLTGASPAVNAGIEAGSERGFTLTPAYEFDASGTISPRPAVAPFDAGAYAYRPLPNQN